MQFRIKWLRLEILAASALVLTCHVMACAAQEPGTLHILGLPEDPKVEALMGNAWAIYLSGQIDSKAGERLQTYVKQNNVPANSYAVLNSPGGSLFGGMELGTVLRRNHFRTDVGARVNDPSNIFSNAPGGCYSACTLAYMGGSFRFLREGSHFGIHRFAFSSPVKHELDVAQVASAAIVAYLRSMDIDTELYTLSTVAGPDQIYEPSLEVLKKLNVVTDGFQKPKWSVESNNGLLYLKGERDTVYGVNKFILFCNPKAGLVLYAIFDAQGHTELMNFQAHSLVINDQEYPITPASKQMLNGWFNAEYALSYEQAALIQSAKSVGLIVQGGYGAPVFLGFNHMPFEDGAKKLVGLLNSCRVAAR